MSIPVLSFFNNKGGVGKTTLCYHLAWMYTKLGMRVLAVDLDPQANLSAAMLLEPHLEDLWQAEPRQTIFGAVQPILKGQGDLTYPDLVFPSDDMDFVIEDSLALLAGDLNLSLFEDALSESWPKCLDGDERAFRVTSAFWRVMQHQAETHEADVILVDIGPNLGAINRAAIISSDFVITPLAADLFSLQGLKNFGSRLGEWRTQWEKRLGEARVDFSLPPGKTQPIGYVIMQPIIRLDRPIKAYDYWLAQIPSTYAEKVLNLVPGQGTEGHELAIIKNYRSLIPMSQESQRPIFDLKAADGAMGSLAQLTLTAYWQFRKLAETIAHKINLPLPPPIS
jgi:cellulose biosynthesis protein BcsQ